MRLRKISEFLIIVYGVVCAIDKLTEFVQNEKIYKESKEYEKKLKKRKMYTDYERISFESKDAAIEALNIMNYIIKEYGYVTVSDFYEICKRVPTVFDTKIGWRTLYDDEVKIKKTNNGWKIIFPRPVYIRKLM